jgi:hypothetical protein
MAERDATGTPANVRWLILTARRRPRRREKNKKAETPLFLAAGRGPAPPLRACRPRRFYISVVIGTQ